MSKDKVTAISLFLEDLKKTNYESNYLTIRIAKEKFQRLPTKEQEKYKVKASRANNINKSKNQKFENQLDSIGNSLKEVEERESRLKSWINKTEKIIKEISNADDVLDRYFYAVHVSGVDYNCLRNDELMYAASEIYIAKFSFNEGIVKEDSIFPNPPDVPLGHKEKLFEELEEYVGYRPDLFVQNNGLDEVYSRLEAIGKKEPIFTATKEQQGFVGLSLYSLYKAGLKKSPWIDSFQDWGQNCRIFNLEKLISNILSKQSENPVTFQEIIRQWQKLNYGNGGEPCVRHQEHGHLSQCARNVLRKQIFASIIIVNSLCNPDKELKSVISDTFYKNISYIFPQDECELQMNTNNSSDDHLTAKEAMAKANWTQFANLSSDEPVTKSNWDGYYIKKTKTDDIIWELRQMTIKENRDKELNGGFITVGQGRGRVRNSEINCSKSKKLTLPNVIA